MEDCYSIFHPLPVSGLTCGEIGVCVCVCWLGGGGGRWVVIMCVFMVQVP